MAKRRADVASIIVVGSEYSASVDHFVSSKSSTFSNQLAIPEMKRTLQKKKKNTNVERDSFADQDHQIINKLKQLNLKQGAATYQFPFSILTKL